MTASWSVILQGKDGEGDQNLDHPNICVRFIGMDNSHVEDLGMFDHRSHRETFY